MDYLLYQAYGRPGIMAEAVISIASAMAHAAQSGSPQPAVIIYTDQPEWFRPFPFLADAHFRLIEAAEIKAWSGELNFVHRVKIKVIQDALSTLIPEDNLIYLDSDTLWLVPPANLFQQIKAGQYLMHAAEGTLANSELRLNRKLGRFVKDRIWNLTQDATITIPQNLTMHNAGVLGFNVNDGREQIQKVLTLSDQLYAAWDRHTMEQLAFSYVLGQGQVVDTANSILHFWRLKGLQPNLVKFLDNHPNTTALDLMHLLNRNLNLVLLNEQQTKWETTPSIIRKVKTLLGHNGDVTQRKLI